MIFDDELRAAYVKARPRFETVHATVVWVAGVHGVTRTRVWLAKPKRPRPADPHEAASVAFWSALTGADPAAVRRYRRNGR